MRWLSALAQASERLAARRSAFLTGCWLVIAGIGLVDHFSGTQIGLSPFYLGPVVLGAWFFGSGVATELAVGAAMFAFVADLPAFDGAGLLIPVWNLLARMAVFLFAAWIVARMRTAVMELRRAASTARETAAELREADEIKNAFLSAVSHELRTPLAAILGSARTLEDLNAVLGDDDRAALLSAVVRNARKLDQLVSDLLDLDRMRRGVATLDLAETDLAKVVLNVLSDVELTGQRPVQVATTSVVAPVDAAKLERMIANLLSNAVKYSPAGSPIRVTLDQVGSDAVISVEDRGRGVRPGDRERVFDPFWRANGDSAVSGIGVGLSLVRSFAELHGGRAYVEPGANGGARFVIALPRVRAAETLSSR